MLPLRGMQGGQKGAGKGGWRPTAKEHNVHWTMAIGFAPWDITWECRIWLMGQSVGPKTLYHRDNVLLYIAYVMLIWAAPIPADRWHCSLWP